MNSLKLKVVLIVSLAFNLAVIATFAAGWARQRSASGIRLSADRAPRGSVSSGCERIAQGMGLCESKAECFKREMTRSSGREEMLKESVRAAREELITLLHAESPDSAAAMRKVEQIGALQSDLEKLLVGRLIRSHNCLDREERERFLGMIGCKYRSGHQPGGKPCPAAGPPGKEESR